MAGSMVSGDDGWSRIEFAVEGRSANAFSDMKISRRYEGVRIPTQRKVCNLYGNTLHSGFATSNGIQSLLHATIVDPTVYFIHTQCWARRPH